MHRILKITAILGVAGLAIGEIALRLAGFGDPPLAQLDDQIEYVLIPNRNYMRFGNRIEINAHGLRAPDLTDNPAADAPRVLVIGDSVIYGNHFLDQSETVAARMTQALAKPTCAPVVVPVAVSSWGPINQAAYLQRHGTFGATVALIVLSGHDLVDTPTGSSNVVPYRLSPSYTALSDAMRAILQRRFGAPPNPSMTYETRAAQSLTALDAMTDQLRAAGIKIFLVYHPTLHERQTQTGDARTRFQDWATLQDVTFMNLGEVLPDPGAYRDHIHPAAGGAEKLARVLAHRAQTALDGC